jgi:hypothetical protein
MAAITFDASSAADSGLVAGSRGGAEYTDITDVLCSQIRHQRAAGPKRGRG